MAASPVFGSNLEYDNHTEMQSLQITYHNLTFQESYTAGRLRSMTIQTMRNVYYAVCI